MRITKFLLPIFFLLSTTFSFAQSTMKGLVTDSNDRPISNVQVTVDGQGPVATDTDGLFEVTLPGSLKKPKEVVIEKAGFQILDWGMSRKVGGLKIVLEPLPLKLRGKVVNYDNAPVPRVRVKFGGFQYDDVVTTKSDGRFTLELPNGTKINNNSRFLVNTRVVSGQYLIYDAGSATATLKIDTLITNTSATSTTDANQQQAQGVQELGDDLFPDDDDLDIPPTLIVVVYEQDITPAESVEVLVDKKKYMTDVRGEFQVFTDSVSDSEFEVPTYEITKKYYDYEDNYMFIHISPPGAEDESLINLDSVSYDENFNFVFNQLESEKQILQQNGQQIRKEITKISTKLDRAGSSEDQRRRLEAHMKRLEEALVENEIAYEDAQYKTREMLDKMKGQIVEQVEKIGTIEDKVELFKAELLLALILGGILLVAVIALFFTVKKVRKQHHELEIAHNNLKTAKSQIEKQRDQMMAVRDIGQEFTAKLELNNHMIELKSYMSAFFDIQYFGIGIVNEITKDLEFQKSVRDGMFIDNFSYSTKDNSRLAVWCFNNKKSIIINDLKKEYTNYINDEPRFESEEVPNSLIYLPLIVENEVLGVMTIHSMNKNAYKDLDSSVVNTLGSYASIAVSNSHAFDVIREKKRNITDSIRYAETIQQAILPSKEQIDKYLSDTFIMYRSKDIVSGDFYWYSHVAEQNLSFLAVVDCTGHGVPGAFMSMIGHTLLNEIINQVEVYDTDRILHELDVRVKAALQQEKGTQTDGMDICLCRISKKDNDTVEVQFTGAKRPLMYIDEEGNVETISGDSKSIASIYHKDKKFSAHTMQLKEGTPLYLTTDGFIDQNNKKRERFGTSNLKALIGDIYSKPMKEQLAILETTLDNHQQEEEQRDDITIVGIKL